MVVNRTWLAVIGAAMVMGAGAAVLAEKDDKGEPAFPPADTTRPMSPGVHHLSYEHKLGEKRRMLTYGLYLPPKIEAAAKRDDQQLPLVVFLCGLGSRGQTEAKLYREGPLNAMRRSDKFKRSMDYLVLHPQVPADTRWENRFMGTFVAEATRRVIDRYPVDPDRVHLVGMSMGGEGVWHAAMGGPELWATVGAVGGRKHPEPDKVAEALKGVTNLIIVGSGDGEFTTGSQAMADAFNAADADVLHVEIPGRGHDIWGFYMPRVAFYEWMLKHRRDAAPPEDRAGAQEILDWAMHPPEDPDYHKFSKRLQKQFERFKPHWFVDNCRKFGGAGLADRALGREGVFITAPLNRHIGARIMTTAKIPEGRKTVLHLSVGHDQGGRWRLVVNVAAHRQLRTDVRHKNKTRLWQDHAIDLTRFAGREVFIEILNKARGRGSNTAYWDRIELVSTDPPAEQAKDGE